ncbi:MAG: flagellin [Planctomycetes bacterium]|nr:flagellin [Planctomycetota bacterium]
MAISISTNTSALQVIRALDSANRTQNRSLLRLATGLRINSPADDPAGSFLASRFRVHLATLTQASENTQLANSQLSTADVTLEQIESLLDTISASVTAVLGGGADVATEQATVDDAIASINRLTLSSRFGSTYLLNNTAAIPVTSKSAALTDVNPRRVEFGSGSSVTFSVVVGTPAEQARLANVPDAGDAAASGATTVRLTGPKGTADISLVIADTGATFGTKVNTVRAQTGVYYDAAIGELRSEAFGSNAVISTETIAGGSFLDDTGSPIDAFQSDTGADAAGTVNGASFGAAGNQVTASTAQFNLTFALRAGTGAGSYSITVAKGGLTYQIGTQPLPSDRLTIGLNTTLASALGVTAETLGGLDVGGFLSSVGGGGANDLSTNPSNASSIVGTAQTQVSSYRSFLGSIISTSLEPTIDALEDTTTEITGALGIVQDTDIATETTTLSLAQARIESATSSLIIANDFPRNLASRLLQALEPK